MPARPVRYLRLPLSLVLGLNFCLHGTAMAGDVPMPTGIECVRDCPGTTTAPSHHHHHYSSSGSTKAMVVGTLFGAILGAALAPPPGESEDEARRKAAEAAARELAEQKARAAAAQAAYDRMMQSYKPLNAANDSGFKSISGTSLGFKTLGGEMDAAAAGARAPFDTPGGPSVPPPPVTGAPTAFFGDSMPMDRIKLLIEPANDPRVVDLRKAKSLVVENLKNAEEARRAAEGPVYTGPSKAECRDMRTKFRDYVTQQTKFNQTILLANEQVDVWEEANRAALINAAKAGIEHFTGELLDTLNRRGEAAERLLQAYERNKARMVADGADFLEVERKIARLKATAQAGKLAGAATDAEDWQGFVKDGASALLSRLNASNAEVLNDAVVQKYLTTDTPELQTLLDVSQMAADAKIFGKWAARQMPIVAWTAFATDQAYNATDWYLSFTRLAEAHRINGKVAEAAKSLQHRIDDTRIALKQCS